MKIVNPLLILLSTIGCLFLLPVKSASATDKSPIIGAQISVLQASNDKECEIYFRQLKNLGYNTVILRVFHNQGDRYHNLIKRNHKLKAEGVYFNTNQLPVISNLLTPVCTKAHQAGLKIFAWMNTLKADYNHRLKDHILSYNQKTGEIESEKNLLDPESRENIKFLIHLYQDLATQPIDGILLQDDLMLRHNQGFRKTNRKITPSPATLYNFQQKNRHKIESYKPTFKNWREHQALVLQNLANKIFSTCRKLKPDLICAENVHYEVFYNPTWGRDWFATTRIALEKSKADCLMVMAYQEQIRRELELKTEKRLTASMKKIFTEAEKWKNIRIIFKFETPAVEISQERKFKSLTTLRKVIYLAQKNHYSDLVLTPCNNLRSARNIKFFNSF